MVTSQEFESIPDEALPVIQRQEETAASNKVNGAVGGPNQQDEVSETLNAIKRHEAEGKELAAKKALHVGVVLERRKKAIAEFDAQLQALGYVDESMPDWVRQTKAAVATKKDNQTEGYMKVIAGTPVAVATTSAKQGKPLHCKICDLDGHDARLKAHRDQKKKAPLSAAQLAALAK